MNYNEFFEYLKKGTVAVTAVDTTKEMLEQDGFNELKMEHTWCLEKKGKYYVCPYPSMIVAFTIGGDVFSAERFRIIATHTDSPAFRIKPNPEVCSEGFITLNVEKYGGAILNTWFDRPLSIAGKVALKNDKIFETKIEHVDFKRPLLTLPNLAVHMNKGVNKGLEIKVQKEMQPLMGQTIENELGKGKLLELLAKELNVDKEEIIDFDLFVYAMEEPLLVGMDNEFISAPRLDNLASCYAAIKALINSNHTEDIKMIAFFDNEEIGSRTKQGADSAIFTKILDKIGFGISAVEQQFEKIKMNSFIISADGAHAYHPNYTEKNDITNKPLMNGGIALKTSGAKKYATELEGVAIIKQICEKADIKLQDFVNHSDEAGGSTLGAIMSSYIPINIVDLGAAMLAMHSTRELMGTKDLDEMIKLFEAYYSV